MADGFATIEAQDVLAVLAPPVRNITHAEVASSLILPDGPRQGERWRWRDDPAQRAIIHALDGRYDSIAAVGAVQTGKSLCAILIPLIRQLIFQNRACVYSQPTQQKLYEAWSGKVQPAILGAGYGGFLPQKGQGSRGSNTPKFVQFLRPSGERAGLLYLIHGGGSSEGAQSSVSAPTVLIDEVDSFPSAHRITLIAKRADAFAGEATRVYTSTVKSDIPLSEPGQSIILSLYEDSTKSRLWYPCPHCERWFFITRKLFSFDTESEESAVNTAHLACPHCASVITPYQHKAMLRDGVDCAHTQTIGKNGDVLGEPPPTKRYGLLWSACDSSIRDLPTLALEKWRAEQGLARGEHALLRSYFRDQWCEPYTGDSEAETGTPSAGVSRARLAALSAVSKYTANTHDFSASTGDRYHLCEAPTWATHATVAVDVQRGGWRVPGRIYFLLLYIGAGRMLIGGWGSLIASPVGAPSTPAQVAHVLDRFTAILPQFSSVPIVRKSVDVGDNTDVLLQWCLAHRDWWPTRGRSREQATMQHGDIPGWLTKRVQNSGQILYFPLTYTIQSRVQNELLAGDVVGGIALPAGQERQSSLIMHLCATIEYAPGKWSESAKDRKHHPEWSLRDDLLQCLAYARCLAYEYENATVKQTVAAHRKRKKYGYLGDLQ